MVDYDWIYDDPQLPYYNYPDKTRWTDRSQHPDTNLNHYYQIDTGLDFYAIEQQKLDLILRFGFRYTDIGFDAYNGDYIYSDQVNGFRGDVGNFTDGLGISYRQKLPGFYLNPRVNWKIAQAVDLTFGGTIGATYKPMDRDHHWHRNLVFVEDLESTTFWGLNATIDYRVTPCLLFYVEGNYDKYTLHKGHTIVSDGYQSSNSGNDAAGADLETLHIKIGFRYQKHHEPLLGNDRFSHFSF